MSSRDGMTGNHTRFHFTCTGLVTMKFPSLRRIALSLMVAATVPLAHAADAAQGAALYQAKCAMCHSPDFNGVGPAHKGVFGRESARAAGYDYSPALKSAHLTWDEANLLRWLTDPEKLVAGQKMFVSVPDAGERADLVAYLRTLVLKK